MVYRTLTAAAFVVAFMTTAQAQQTPGQAPDPQTQPPAVVTPAPDTAGTPMGAAQGINPELAEMTVAEIAGRPLLNQEGGELGNVRSVARNNQDGSLNAIVAIGGFLGFGQRQVAVPLSEIQFQENRLITTMAQTRSELRNRTTAFDEQNFETLAEQTRIADAAAGGPPESAGAPGQPPAAAADLRFENVDADGDGFISAQEAEGHGGLSARWVSLDTNQDGRLDRAEFAAFSEQTGGPMGQQGQKPQGGAMRDQDQLRQRDPTRDQDQLRQRDPTRGSDQMRQRDQAR